MAAIGGDHRQSTPGAEDADMAVALLGFRQARIVKAERDKVRVERRVVEAVKEIIFARASDCVAAPDHLALPEGKRDLTGDDHSRLSDALDQRTGESDRACG